RLAGPSAGRGKPTSSQPWSGRRRIVTPAPARVRWRWATSDIAAREPMWQIPAWIPRLRLRLAGGLVGRSAIADEAMKGCSPSCPPPLAPQSELARQARTLLLGVAGGDAGLGLWSWLAPTRHRHRLVGVLVMGWLVAVFDAVVVDDVPEA